MTPDQLVDELRIHEDRMGSMGRLVPTSFDATDPNTSAFPLPPDFAWSSCSEILRSFSVTGVMMRLPLLWQMESPLHAACRSADAFLFVNDRGNMPLGAASVRDAHIDAVVTDYSDALIFSAFLKSKDIPLPGLWIVVHSPEEAAQLIDLSGPKVAREIHVFPGFPALVQCPELVKRGGLDFHASELVLVQIGPKAIISTGPGMPYQFTDLELPFGLSSGDSCGCGRHTYTLRT